MSIEKKIDDLIETGWHVLESDFDQAAFQKWRKQAVDCVNALLGPDHTYSGYFRDDIREAGQKNLLTATGVLFAVREEMTKKAPLTEGGRNNS